MTDSNRTISRRKMLGATGTLIAASLAGCQQPYANDDTNDTTTNPDGTDTNSTTEDFDFEFPDGFTADSIDLETALGSDSVMANLGSVELTLTRSIASPSQTQSEQQNGVFSKTNDKFYIDTQTESGETTGQQEVFYTDGIVYIRQDYPNQDSVQYQKDTFEFNSRTVYNLAQLQQHLQSLSVSVDRIETTDAGTDVAVYTASTDDFTQETLFGSLAAGQSYGELESGSLELRVDSNGYIHLADFNAEFANQGEDNTVITTVFEYGAFNDASVSRPSWVDENEGEFEDLTKDPTATVAFSETEGEQVTVEVSDIKNADRVDVVTGNSLLHRFEESGTTEIAASDYTTDGEAQTITVYAYRENQQPTKIKTYTPNAPASGSGSTTTTTTTQ